MSARVRGNAAQACVWMDRALKLRKPECRDSTEAAIALCEGRREDALRHIEATRAFLNRRKADSGIARFAKEKLDEMEKQAEQTQNGAAVSQTAV